MCVWGHQTLGYVGRVSSSLQKNAMGMVECARWWVQMKVDADETQKKVQE